MRGRNEARVGVDMLRVALSVREYAGAMTGTMTGAIAHHEDRNYCTPRRQELLYTTKQVPRSSSNKLFERNMCAASAINRFLDARNSSGAFLW